VCGPGVFCFDLMDLSELTYDLDEYILDCLDFYVVTKMGYGDITKDMALQMEIKHKINNNMRAR
jgi:hypothetical protein